MSEVVPAGPQAASSAANHSVSVLVNPQIWFEVRAQGAAMALEDAIVLAESSSRPTQSPRR